MDTTTLRNIRREQVRRCLCADMTIKEWCGLNKVSQSTFYKWAAVFRREEPELFGTLRASDWVEISKAQIKAETALEIVTPPAEDVTAHTFLSASVGAAQVQADPAPIHARTGSIEVIIPLGTPAADIAAVLGVAVSL